MRNWTMSGLIVLCGLVVSTTARAQGFGRIVGTVTDPARAVIVNATVIATESGRGFSRSSTTDTSGYYVLDSLRPAPYDLRVEASGFHTWEQKAVTLLADQTLIVNVGMQVGAVTESVFVSTDPNQVDVTTPTLKQAIEAMRITELPANGRNAAEFTLLVPGSVGFPNATSPTATTAGGALQGVTKTFPGAVAIAVNGARQNQVSYQLDGGNYVDEYTNVNQPFPMPDALQEFSVQTSNYTAEYGQNAGAVVNIITKSGTNSFHGSAFEFVRTPALNARRWDQAVKDVIHRNQFGGTIGGPIRHDRTFFFAAYQGSVIHNVIGTTSGAVPNAAQRASATDPAVIKLLTFIPAGDPTNGNRVTFARPDFQNFQEITGRVDHAFSKMDLLSVRYFYDRFKRNGVFDPANALNYSDGSTIRSQNLLVHLTHIFASNRINDLRFSFAPETAQRGPASNAISVQDLGVNIPFQPAPKAIQAIRVGGGFTLGDNPTASFLRRNFTVSDDFSWVTGKHDLKFGGVLERSHIDLDNQFFQPAEFTFASMTAFLAGQLSNSGSNPAFRQGAGEFKNNRNTFVGLYIQDNYRVSRRLILNLGLRWEPGLPWKEIMGRVEQFRLSGLNAGIRSTQFPNAPPGVYFPGDPGVPTDGVRRSLNNFAPRVGFAYDVFGDGRTSVRGGLGIFYDTRLPGIINNRFVDATPFSPQLILLSNAAGPAGKPGTFSDPLCLLAATQAARGCAAATNPFPSPFPPPSNTAFGPNLLVVSWDPDNKYQVPTLYEWNLAIERQLPSNVLVRAAYVGSHGSHLKETIALNVSPVGGGTPRLNAIAGPNVFGTGTNGVVQDLQDINSSYNALQLSLERRVTRGVTILANYTWSKSIDDLPAGGGVADIGADTVSARPWDDPLRHPFDRGPSDFDRTHNFVASFVWQLPGLSRSNKLIKNVFGNWQLGGIVTARSGRPLTIVSGTERSGTGIGQDRAKLIGAAYGPGACAAAGITTRPCMDWLNPAGFAQADLGTFGNVGKGSLTFPGFYAWDMSLSKTFLITERWKVQLRGEFFNVFNHVNFLSDDGTVGSGSNFARVSATSSFGAITTATDPRIGQLALKIIF